MIVHEVMILKAEVEYKKRAEIKGGVTLRQDNENILEVICKTQDKDAALAEAKKHLPKCDWVQGFASGFYEISECVIATYKEDEEGEFVDGTDYDYPYDFVWNEEKETIDII